MNIRDVLAGNFDRERFENAELVAEEYSRYVRTFSGMERHDFIVGYQLGAILEGTKKKPRCRGNCDVVTDEEALAETEVPE